MTYWRIQSKIKSFKLCDHIVIYNKELSNPQRSCQNVCVCVCIVQETMKGDQHHSFKHVTQTQTQAGDCKSQLN